MSSAYTPNTTQTPDIIYDRWLAILNGSELKVLLYIVRRTYGFGKRDGDAISLNQMVSGIRRTTRSGGECDWGTGLDKDTVVASLDVLEGIGLVNRQKAQAPNGANEANLYSLNLDAPVPERASYKAQLRRLRAEGRRTRKDDAELDTVESIAKAPLSEIPPSPSPEIPTIPLVGKSDKGWSEKSDYPLSENSYQGGGVGVVGNSDTQQTVGHTERQTGRQTARAERELPNQPVPVVCLPSKEVVPEPERIPEGAEDDPRHELVQRLVKHGVKPDVAQDLVARFAARCAKVLEYLPYADVRSTAGYIVSAVRGNWAPPQGYLTAQKQQAEPVEVTEPPVRRVSVPRPAPSAPRPTETVEALLDAARQDPVRWAELERQALGRLPEPMRRSGKAGVGGIAHRKVLESKMREILAERV